MVKTKQKQKTTTHKQKQKKKQTKNTPAWHASNYKVHKLHHRYNHIQRIYLWWSLYMPCIYSHAR